MAEIRSERITAEEYIRFLARTDLGSQYPQERFEERIGRLVRNASVSLTARDAEGELVGVLLGLTDFAYWLYVTDLGVDRRCLRQGIGRALMRDERYGEAMHCFEVARDARNYGEALRLYRKEWVEENVGWIFPLIIVLLAGPLLIGGVKKMRAEVNGR